MSSHSDPEELGCQGVLKWPVCVCVWTLKATFVKWQQHALRRIWCPPTHTILRWSYARQGWDFLQQGGVGNEGCWLTRRFDLFRLTASLRLGLMHVCVWKSDFDAADTPHPHSHRLTQWVENLDSITPACSTSVPHFQSGSLWCAGVPRCEHSSLLSLSLSLKQLDSLVFHGLFSFSLALEEGFFFFFD